MWSWGSVRRKRWGRGKRSVTLLPWTLSSYSSMHYSYSLGWCNTFLFMNKVFPVCDPKYGVSLFRRLVGYVSRCTHGCGRSAVDRQYYYCNGRPFELHRVRELPCVLVSLFYQSHLSLPLFLPSTNNFYEIRFFLSSLHPCHSYPSLITLMWLINDSNDVIPWICALVVASCLSLMLVMQLSKTVNEVYHTYNRHQSPFVVLDIKTSRGTIDDT